MLSTFITNKFISLKWWQNCDIYSIVLNNVDLCFYCLVYIKACFQICKIIAYLMACMLWVNLWVIPVMKTESMFLFCSWLNSMSTCGMVLWHSARTKQKTSSSNILVHPPASLLDTASNLLYLQWFGSTKPVHVCARKLCTTGSSMALLKHLEVCWPALHPALTFVWMTWMKKNEETPPVFEKNWRMGCGMFSAAWWGSTDAHNSERSRPSRRRLELYATLPL